MLIHSHLHLCF